MFHYPGKLVLIEMVIWGIVPYVHGFWKDRGCRWKLFTITTKDTAWMYFICLQAIQMLSSYFQLNNTIKIHVSLSILGKRALAIHFKQKKSDYYPIFFCFMVAGTLLTYVWIKGQTYKWKSKPIYPKRRKMNLGSRGFWCFIHLLIPIFCLTHTEE